MDHRAILDRLRRAIIGERRRGLARHWSYDVNRHAALLQAYRGELAALAEQPKGARAAPARTPRSSDRRDSLAPSAQRPRRR